jgi:hypothetical protein
LTVNHCCQESFKPASGKDEDGLNACITFRAEQAGAYCIRTTTFNVGIGPFTLTLREWANPLKDEKK